MFKIHAKASPGAVFVSLLTGLLCAHSVAEPPGTHAFERVFGVPLVVPADILDQVQGMAEGERLSVDRDGDGIPDAQWYFDTRHRQTIQPLLVYLLDEDGDLRETGRGDLDSDLYLWDWNADGSFDAATDYQDDDGDGDVDQMGIFYKKSWPDKEDDITVWWGQDIGDDNLLWYDVNGNYYQDLCQYRTHFSGDETFYQFRLKADSEYWINVFEDPFAFWDPDGDQCSEVVVRVCATEHDVTTLRYSIDVDDDAFGRDTHDYDFSITAIPGDTPIHTDENNTVPLMVRGIPAHPVLPWENTRGFAQAAAWGSAMLTWDEVNSNTEAEIERDPNERWEGIINRPSKLEDFAQVGGPPTSTLNKRVEVSPKPAAPLRLYYDASDHRLHLLGARHGYLDVDFDLDGEIDMAYVYTDENGDGVLDRRTVDVDGDGTVDLDWKMAGNTRAFALEFEEIAPFYTEELDRVLLESQEFVDAAKSLLGDAAPVDTIETYFLEELDSYHPEREVGARIRRSPAGARYYLNLLSDRLFFALSKQYAQTAWFPAVEAQYAAGDLAEAARGVAAQVAEKDRVDPRRYASYTDRLAIQIDNSGGPERVDAPVVVRLDQVEAALSSLPGPKRLPQEAISTQLVVVRPDRWVDWIEVPSQVDVIDQVAGPELSFLVDLHEGEIATYYLHCTQEETESHPYPRLTGAGVEIPAYVGLESEYAAYRFYTGQFDFFGKHQDRRLPKPERLLYPEKVSGDYHTEQEWGMDALHVYKTSGLGGLSLRHANEVHLVQSPAGEGEVKFAHRVLTQGPVRAAVGITATNLIPGKPEVTAEITCVIYAEHQECEVRARVSGMEGAVQLAPGLLKLTEERSVFHEALGTLGAWGYQGEDIGEIGVAVIVPSDRLLENEDRAEERRLWCATEDNRLRYWILGDWRRGRQYPIGPTIDNWSWEIRTLAETLQHTPEVSLGAPEAL